MENRDISRRKFITLSAGAVTLVGAGAAYLRWGRASSSAIQESASASAADNSIAVAARALGNDLNRIFAFVRDEIRYEPYSGILRGARGTLLARAGNSADQALLLAELLRSGSIPVRFVTGPIDQTNAEFLMAATVTDADKEQRRIDQAISGSTEDSPVGAAKVSTKAANRIQLDPTELHNAFKADLTKSVRTTSDQLKTSVATVTKALTAAGIKLPADTTQLPASERASHTWVQANTGSSWVDLDPSFVNAKPGTALATGASADALGDELRHRITFKVLAESMVSGNLSRETIFEASLFADELSGENILFTHLPAEQMVGINLVGSAGSRTKRYNPVLVIGAQAHVGRKPVALGDGSSAADMMTDALGGGGGSEGLSEGEASAEWIEVHVVSPGAKPAVGTRVVFDRVGLAARQRGPALDSIPAAEFVDIKDGAGSHYLPCRSLWAFSVCNGPVSLSSLLERVSADSTPRLSLIPAGYDVMRHMFGGALAAEAGCRRFNASPNVTSWFVDATAGGYTHGLDIWHRDFGTTRLTGLTPIAPPPMIAGILSHVVERSALGDGTAGGGGRVTVGAIFDAASSQGIPVHAISGRLPADTQYDADHRARIEEALGAGLVVVAPERAVDLAGQRRLGWWLVNATTGETVDELDNGRGGNNEYVKVVGVGSALGTGVAAYGWHVLNMGMKYVGDPKVSIAIDNLWKALMAMTPPGGGAGS